MIYLTTVTTLFTSLCKYVLRLLGVVEWEASGSCADPKGKQDATWWNVRASSIMRSQRTSRKFSFYDWSFFALVDSYRFQLIMKRVILQRITASSRKRTTKNWLINNHKSTKISTKANLLNFQSTFNFFFLYIFIKQSSSDYVDRRLWCLNMDCI